MEYISIKKNLFYPDIVSNNVIKFIQTLKEMEENQFSNLSVILSMSINYKAQQFFCQQKAQNKTPSVVFVCICLQKGI